MAYALTRTSRLKVGTTVAVLPGRHPVLVARQLATHPGPGAARGDRAGAPRGRPERLTPLYSGSYNGLFKSFFDVLDPGALAGKPVLIGATGTARPSLALEHAIRPLFTYLRAITVLTAVFAATEDWGAAGGSAQALTARIDRAGAELAGLLGQREPAAEADPYASVTPFGQLLNDR